ncbi:ABC transporter ATP-binding protein/permease [Aerococcaceae bacterium NML191219]|nr:ABC transporter ATP-binding protein/permease [Aerococcaceae bacterium NML191219]
MKKEKTFNFFKQLIRSIGILKVCLYVITIVVLFLLIGIQPFIISELFSFTKSKIDYIYLGLLLLSFLSVSFVAFPQNYMLQKIRKFSKSIVFKDITEKSYSEFINMNLGEVQNLASEISYSARSLQYESISFILNVLLIISLYAATLLSYDIYIGSIYTLFCIIYLWLSIVFSKDNAQLIQTALDATSETNSFFVDYFKNAEIIISTYQQKSETQIYDNVLENEEKRYFNLQKRIDTYRLLLQLILAVMTVLMIGLVLNKDSDVNITYILVLIYSSIHMNGFGKQFLSVLESLDRLELALDKIKFGTSDKMSRLYSSNSDNNLLISLKNVHFTHGDKTIFENLDLDIRFGKFILIRGGNGSGKSTLLKLIKGMIKPNSGNITHYLSSEKIGYLSQKMTLFNRSLKENMIYPLKNIEDSALIDLVEELKLTSLVPNIQTLSEKKPGDFGDKLSGGEKQKILIARGIINQYEALLLDEIDSALDLEMQKNLIKILKKYYRGKTVVVVSHREMDEELFDKVIDIELHLQGKN